MVLPISLAGLPIPSDVSGFIGLLVQVIIIFLVIVILDFIIAHDIEVKRSLIMAVVAYLLVPFILVFIPLSIPYALQIYLVPLAIWIVLGELLLTGAEAKKRLIVAAAAFVIYTVLTYVGVAQYIAALF